MKVLIAHALDPGKPAQGGTVRYFSLIIEELVRRGINVTLLGTGDREDDLEYRYASVDKSGWWFSYLLRLFLKVKRLRISSDAVVHTGRLDTMLPFLLWSPGNPKVLTSDTPLYYVKTSLPFGLRHIVAFVYNLLERWAVRRIDAIATDDRTKRHFLHKYPWLEAKIHPIEGSVDLLRFKPMPLAAARRLHNFRENDKIVMFVGRLEPVKNIPYLLEAFLLLKETEPRARLVIVGGGSERPRLEGIIAREKIPDVTFWGAFPPEKMPGLLSCADTLALCSLTEGSPMVVREALACGVPVTSLPVGDVPSTIDGPLLGRIVDGSPQDFAKGLASVLALPARARIACRAKAQAFSKERMVTQLVAVYRRVAS